MVRLQSIQGDRPIAKGARHGLGGLAGLEQIFFAPYRFERRYGGRLSCEPEVVSGKKSAARNGDEVEQGQPASNQRPARGRRTVVAAARGAIIKEGRFPTRPVHGRDGALRR